MLRETKFGYGVLLVGVGVPFLIDKVLGLYYAIVVSVACVVIGGAFLLAGHRHREGFVRRRKILEVLAFGAALSTLIGLGSIGIFRVIPKRETAESPKSTTQPAPETHGTTDTVGFKPQPHGTEDSATARVKHPPNKSVQESQLQTPIIQTQAPYGNLAARCDELGTEIIAAAESRNKVRPDSTRPDEYKEWYRLNDGLFFHAPFYRHIAKIHQELSDLHIDDPRLDELIKQHEEYFAGRQKNAQAAYDHPEMFHLSIEEIKEIGERFKFLATQVPH